MDQITLVILHGQKIHINSPKQLILLKIRIGDRIIIEELINFGLKDAYLVRINRVENYIKVLYISDITEGNVRKKSIFNGKIDQSTKSQYM